MYNRILLKLSGEALAGTSNGFDAEVLARIANEVKEITEMGIQVAIVVGGGNFIRGSLRNKWESIVCKPTTWACWER